MYTLIRSSISRGSQYSTKLHQGDPMSLIIFNIVEDMLALLIKKRAKDCGQIRIIPQLVEYDLIMDYPICG
jgi:hypothetical protein